MAFTAPIMDKTPEDLARSITETITELGKLWASLPNERKTYLELWCHSTLPQASAIMIDEQAGTGLIQLETKAYKARRIDSFAFEIRAGTEFYSMLQNSYADLIKDGRQLLPR